MAAPAASPARRRILDTADRLFYEEGIHAVGINRLIDEAGVTRVTLYRHFPSKDDLVAAYLEGRAQYDRDQVAAIVDRHAANPRAALMELATVLTDADFGAVRRGCPFINSAAEFDRSHVTRRYAREHRAWVTAALESLLARDGHPDPRAAAHQLMMVRTGAVVSGALDENPALNDDFLTCWAALVDHPDRRAG